MKLPANNKISTNQKKNSNNWLYLLLIAIVYWIVYATFFDAKLDLNGDNATYIQLARNIANGYGYADVGIHGATPASHFPPAYSAFLSVFIWLGIDSLVFFKLLNGILLFASYILLFFIVKKSTKNKILAFSSVAVAVFAPSIMRFATICMSEVLFGFCCIACFFVW
ncbi:hypothetical protein FACS1894178_3220 [Bacteroidia bacterium]|nr:hypothetical protein FACS1894178_3220 [Bacteroidia bacterium]